MRHGIHVLIWLAIGERIPYQEIPLKTYGFTLYLDVTCTLCVKVRTGARNPYNTTSHFLSLFLPTCGYHTPHYYVELGGHSTPLDG